MKKKVMRVIAVAVATVLLVGCFAGCKKTVCDWCGEKARCETMYLSLLGEYNMCKECRELVAPISEGYKAMDEKENGKQ